MATNLIQSRIAEELAHHLPFSKMDKTALNRLAAETIVKYVEDKEILFEIGDAPQKCCWFIRQGQVSLYNKQQHELVLVDICEEGELFGLRSLITTEAYSLQAVVHKEALLYGIPVKRLSTVMESSAAVALHFANVLASRVGTETVAVADNNQILKSKNEIYNGQLLLNEANKPPVICNIDTPIKQAAEIMSVQKVSSIVVVNDLGFPLGIVTTADLSKKVATGIFPIEAQIGLIMSSPVICCSLPISFDDASLLLLQNGMKHLVLTENGSITSKIVGVITPQDLQQTQRISAQNMLKQIQKAATLEELSNLALKIPEFAAIQLDNDVPTLHLTSVIGVLNEAVIQKAAFYLKINKPVLNEISWCWVTMGSMARAEQLFPTDQDHALIYQLSENSQEEIDIKAVKKELVEFSVSLKDFLVASGFEACPANMMASNPEWCLSLKEWKTKFEGWIRTPTPKNVMHSSIFFDMKAVLGDSNLLLELQSFLAQEIKEHSDFLTYLAADALKNPPPMGFFKQFVVEKDGAHKDQFDIKSRALMPLVDLARLLALAASYTQNVSTQSRFSYCANMEENHKKLLLSAAKAHQQLLRYRFGAYKKTSNSGRFLSLNELDTFDKQVLKQCFKPIEALRQIIEVRFNTNLLRQ